MLGESVFTTKKRVGGLQKLVGLAEVGRVRFDHQKACRRLAELYTVRYHHRKVGRRMSVQSGRSNFLENCARNSRQCN